MPTGRDPSCSPPGYALDRVMPLLIDVILHGTEGRILSGANIAPERGDAS